MKQIVGWMLLSTPFVGIFAVMWREGGFKNACIVAVLCGAAVTAILIGVVLVHS